MPRFLRTWRGRAFLFTVLRFDFNVVTLNPGVVSYYNPIEKLLVFPGFVRQFLIHKHATVSLRLWAIEVLTSWRSIEYSSFPLKFAERIHMRPASDLENSTLSGFVEDCMKFLQDLFSEWPVEESLVCSHLQRKRFSRVYFVPTALSTTAVLSISCVSNAVFQSMKQCKCVIP